MTQLPCRACGSPNTRFWIRVAGYSIVRCAGCGSATTDSVMDPQSARAYYQESYFQGGDYDDYRRDEQIIKRNFERFALALAKRNPNGRLLEVGCAYGYFLDVAQKRWAVDGIDVSVPAIDAAQQRHPGHVFCGDLLTFPLKPGTYDWVVAWDVIEHVDRPREYLQRMRQLLRPGGRLALTTGDFGSMAAKVAGRRWRLLTPPSHLTYFTRSGIRSALGQAGLAVESITTAGYERTLSFTLFRLVGAVLAQRLFPPGSRRRRWIERARYFLDIGDVMFVAGQFPAGGGLR